MKKIHLFLSAAIIFSLFPACEEEGSPILFEIENISNADNVKIVYSSPDPSCMPKMYTIYTNNQECTLTLKCSNADPIFFDRLGSSVTDYNCNEGNWSANLIDSNTIGFSFGMIDSENSNETAVGDALYVYAQNKKGEISTSISVVRFTQSSETFR